MKTGDLVLDSNGKVVELVRIYKVDEKPILCEILYSYQGMRIFGRTLYDNLIPLTKAQKILYA